MTPVGRRIAFAGAGLVYGLLMVFWGAVGSGGGHFNLLMMVFVSPYGLGLLFWPLWSYIVAVSLSPFMRAAFVATMSAHYLGLLHYIFLTDNSDSYWFANGARQSGFVLLVAVTLAVYLAGHLFLWIRFVRSIGTVARLTNGVSQVV